MDFFGAAAEPHQILTDMAESIRQVVPKSIPYKVFGISGLTEDDIQPARMPEQRELYPDMCLVCQWKPGDHRLTDLLTLYEALRNVVSEDAMYAMLADKYNATFVRALTFATYIPFERELLTPATPEVCKRHFGPGGCRRDPRWVLEAQMTSLEIQMQTLRDSQLYARGPSGAMLVNCEVATVLTRLQSAYASLLKLHSTYGFDHTTGEIVCMTPPAKPKRLTGAH